MPMCESGVPERHTTAANSSKMGARNVAPASATHAITPSALVSINSRTSSGDDKRRQSPCTGAASNTLVPLPISAIGDGMYTVARHYDLGVPGLDETTFLVLHEVRLRGVVELDDSAAVTELIEVGYVARSPKGVRITALGREEHTALARVSDSEIEAMARRAYERFLPLNRELIRICNDWQVRPGGA